MSAPVEFAVSGTKLVNAKSAQATPLPRHVQSAGRGLLSVIPTQELFLSVTSNRGQIPQHASPDSKHRVRPIPRKPRPTASLLPPMLPVNLPEIMVRGLGGNSEDIGEEMSGIVNHPVPFVSQSRRTFIMSGSSMLRGRVNRD